MENDTKLDEKECQKSKALVWFICLIAYLILMSYLILKFDSFVNVWL